MPDEEQIRALAVEIAQKERNRFPNNLSVTELEGIISRHLAGVPKHRIAAMVGKHNDDPLWDEISENVKRARATPEQSPRVCVNCGCPWYEVSESPVPDGGVEATTTESAWFRVDLSSPLKEPHRVELLYKGWHHPVHRPLRMSINSEPVGSLIPATPEEQAK